MLPARQALLALVEAKGAMGDDLYPPVSTELRLYAGLLSAYRDDRAGVEEALRRNVGGFTGGQKAYLAFHREGVFLEARYNK